MRFLSSPISALSGLLLVAVACLSGVWASVPEETPSRERTTEGPMPAEEAARTMIVPKGFKVTVFASEPDVAQPIGFCFDDRGRLWVAENYGYPVHSDKPGKDRILILEDTDGDGKHDVRKVFFEGLNYVTGIEYGFGGAWVMSPPYFYFIPDKNGDDKPDGKPEVLLDGFGNHANSHNLASALAWGPDGWLYGTHGRTNWSMIGKPGTLEQDRKRFDGGVYRYHPVRHEWEAYCDGMTNPWGIDWNDYGQAFVCNCVDPHLFEVIQGAHYEPWRNRESSKYAYERIATIADHRHFISDHNVRDGLGTLEEDTAGGGHAHCGTMIYLGDNWPAEYRGQVFMNNIHGKRINCDLLQRKGSGYTASHGKDLMRNRDSWFMGVTLAYGPDGGVYVSDWSDTGECHSTKNTQKATGRIYKISYGTPKSPAIDLSKLRVDALAGLQDHDNEWIVRHARRRLMERFEEGGEGRFLISTLIDTLKNGKTTPKKLRAMWAAFAIGAINNFTLIEQLKHKDEYLRAWSVQFLCDDQKPSKEVLSKLIDLAQHDSSPLVRRYLASAAQRLDSQAAWPIVEALAARQEDAEDQNIPYLVWYAAEPLIANDQERFCKLAASSKIPFVQRSVARRIASTAEANTDIDELLKFVEQGLNRGEILQGILNGLEGRRTMRAPASWPAAFAAASKDGNAEAKMLAVKLAIKFGDQNARRTLATVAADARASAEDRNEAVASLISGGSKDLASLLILMLDDPVIAGTAIRGLAHYDHPGTANVILKKYAMLERAAKQDAIQTLCSRHSWASALLDAVENRQGVDKSAITAFSARQIANLGDSALTERLKRVWGEIRPSATERANQISALKKRLTPGAVQRANRIAGKGVFEKECATCHRFFGKGAAIGPEITGAQRTNLDYLLENIVDPNASISRDFQMEIIETEDGRVISGLVIDESDAAVTIQAVNEKIIVPKAEIANRQKSPLSMMPDGIAQKLTFEQMRDLIAYVSSPGPVAAK
jgi:putative membrane-bound dehydrogenase-like protein